MPDTDGVRLPQIVTDILKLFTDLYPLIDKANYFLELHAGASGINVGVTNLRDAVSHLVTVLENPTLTLDDVGAALAMTQAGAWRPGPAIDCAEPCA